MSFGEHVGDVVRQSASWITSQRWYGDKARHVADMTPETIVHVPVGDHNVAVAVVRFRYEQGDDARYLVPVIVDERGDATSEMRDALRDPAFLLWFLDGFRDERLIASDASWQWRRFGGDLPIAGDPDPLRVRVLSAEQSNTSVVFDDRLVGKVFRRLQPGINPDLEIGEFLTRQGRFPHVPALYGVVELREGEDETAIAALQEFVPNLGDGWQWLLAQLDAGSATRRESVEAVARLGKRTGELHLALAADAEDPAFAPEPFTEQDAHALNARVIAEMEQSVEGLAKRLPPDEVAALHKGIGQMMSGAFSLVGTSKVRVHGDYHLGQTLRTPDGDFCIIDFEGEPSRTIDERRLKQSALKDVAGLIRSLDYAVATATERSDDPGRHKELAAWGKAAREAYVGSYLEVVRGAPWALVPADDQRFDEGLRLQIVEKALYEARYEMNNRPDWLSIPLNALRRLAGVPLPG